MQLKSSPSAKPTDNAFAEAFNGRFRDESLGQYWFTSLEEVRKTLEAWRIEDNTERPMRARGQQMSAT